MLGRFSSSMDRQKTNNAERIQRASGESRFDRATRALQGIPESASYVPGKSSNGAICSIPSMEKKSIDPFLCRMQSSTYNCMDFTREVWLFLTDGQEDVVEKLKRLVGDFTNRKVTASGLKGFQKLKQPVSPCFAVMQRFKFTPHVGIYIDGRILHLHNRGVELREPNIAKSYYQRIAYYR
jgi:hypothetical protein